MVKKAFVEIAPECRVDEKGAFQKWETKVYVRVSKRRFSYWENAGLA
ncbi:hypothetical protein B4098_0896 [Heyndrickxia coagulans]|uniref:Uncharacterized protein n=1 Tax=Heyndrickxia coagulans TaxID=1398 RepID=A0A150JZU4_HEYCO|nr:hypothetical protein BCO26_0323 [Heyndrickxia coagulans 2-6]KYC62726.1 hypothetical protein B4098_0896 [Heyndrickxia coagulans]